MTRGTERDFSSAHPTTAELVVEVAASSALLDRENASLYAEAGVSEYWIVLGQEHQVEVYRRPVNGHYLEQRFVALDGVLDCATLPKVRVKVSDLFVSGVV